MTKYGVTHRLATTYYPQTSGQVEVSNHGMKRLLERKVGENRASWPDKLDDALWASHTAFKTPIGCTRYKLVYGKAYHLTIKLEHKVYWALKHANFDLKIAELSQPDGPTFKENGHRVKHYFGGDIPSKVSIKDIEYSSRPARSILTLNTLPTIDPKDKGKARLVYKEELAELEREKEKRQREEEASKAAIAKMYDEVQKRVIDDFKPMDSDDAVDKEKVLEEPNSTKIEVKQEGDEESFRKRPGRRLKMKSIKKSKRQNIDSNTKEEEHLKTYLFDRMDLEELYNLVMQRFEKTSPEARMYPLTKETLERMLALRLIVECESKAIFDLLRFIQKKIDESGSHHGSEKDLKELASPKKAALDKDIANSLIVNSLIKTIWLSIHHVIAMKHWLF
nr:reverse transcriptase domain-containing protein [Tanacetum cinerariifolium]